MKCTALSSQKPFGLLMRWTHIGCFPGALLYVKTWQRDSPGPGCSPVNVHLSQEPAGAGPREAGTHRMPLDGL